MALHLSDQQAVLNAQLYYNHNQGGVCVCEREECASVCVCIVEVMGSVKTAARGVELSPACIHWSSGSQHNLKGLQGVRGINCSCNLRP